MSRWRMITHKYVSIMYDYTEVSESCMITPKYVSMMYDYTNVCLDSV